MKQPLSPTEDLEPRKKAGRLLGGLEAAIFIAAIICLLLNKNIMASLLLSVTLCLRFYTSFQLKQEDIEDPVHKFWFGLISKTLVNVIFIILLLRVLWKPLETFPMMLCFGVVTLTLRNVFYLAFSISWLKENKLLPMNSFWGKMTTAILNVTMILYSLGIETVTLKIWRLEKDVQNLSKIFMVLALLLMGATIVGYIYYYYRDADHRKPISVASQLTISRIILSPVFIWVFFYDSNLTYQDNNLLFKAVALLMVIFFAISDGLDGYLARKLGQVSKLGKYLDPFSDKISNMSIFLCFLASGYATVWMIALIYFREATIETLRTLAAGEGIIIDARRSGKWKTGIQVGVVIAILAGEWFKTFFEKYYPEYGLWDHLWSPVPHWLMYGVTVVTLVSGVDYIVANTKVLKKYI